MIKRIAALIGLAAFGAAFGLFIVWPDADAPKRDDLTFDRPVSPTRHVAPAMRADLQSELDRLGYSSQKAVTNDNEVRRTYQIWTNASKPKVELNDLGSGIYRLHTVAFQGGAGTWQQFWCSPAKDDETLAYVINTGKQIKKEIENGTASLSSDIETPVGTKFVRLADLNGEPLMTCYVSN